MRYLLTTDATKPHGGVKFEPVTRAGGQLFGTLAIEDGADEIIAGSKNFVKEISKADYDLYQKKREHFLRSKNSFQMPHVMGETLFPAKSAAKVEASAKSSSALRAEDILTPRKVK